MVFDTICIVILTALAFVVVYFAFKSEIKREKKLNALYDEMYQYFKNVNDRSFNL